MLRTALAAGLLLHLAAASAGAQGPAEAPSAVHAVTARAIRASEAGALRVFLDCQQYTPCYWNYVKTELTYVDYVNVREAADVHILVTSLGTGAGGREFTMRFIGLGDFAGMNDELLYVTLPTDTEELARRGFVRMLKLGLVRYQLRAGLAGPLEVTHEASPSAARPANAARSGSDPWDYWVFRARFNGRLDSESASRDRETGGSFSANRVTEAWKLSLSGYQNYREARYTYSDGSSYTSVRRSFDVTGQAVKSLTPHWSAGAKAFVAQSTYENKDRVLNGTAAVEFNVYPYAESTRRQLTFQYLVAVTDLDYKEETVYQKLRETVASHTLRSSFDLRQTWGSLSADADFSQYFHNPSLRRRSLAVEADVRLFKGFALSVFARTAAIHNQIYLPAGDATDEEVLARQRQLATSFRHTFHVGVSYTFGSIFSNVVNTRLSNFVGG
ncbi:MAG TPA: hypothetical protein PLT35_00190 [Vicinamibacterales bacterium]|nr:hypothetical protein [Vicinamibacterales bacterium]